MIRSLLLATAALVPFAAAAEPLAVVGSWSGLPLHKEFEAPFWTGPAAEAGFEVQLTTHDQMGLGVGEVFNLLGDGVYDVASTVADYAVADAPELEGLDVPLIALTAAEEKAAVDAARPMVEDIFRDRFNAHVLAIAPYPPQVVFCATPIEGLADLKGKKIRASGRMTAKFLEALGAEGVNLAFSEVPGALQRGVVDCAVTGAGSGYAAGWWEVSTHLLDLPLGGWDPVVTAINLDKWNALSPGQQEALQSAAAADLEAPAWAAAEGALENDVACLTGGTCASGEARSMTLVEASEADFAEARRILESEVLPDWAERSGGDWAVRWTESVGAGAGVAIGG